MDPQNTPQNPTPMPMPPAPPQPVNQQPQQALNQTSAPPNALGAQPLGMTFKNIKYCAILSIVLGILTVLFGVWGALYVSPKMGINVVFGLALLVLGIKLKSAVAVASVLLYLKLILATLLVVLLFALLSGNGGGFLNILLLYFAIKAANDLYNAKLIDKKQLLFAKPLS